MSQKLIAIFLAFTCFSPAGAAFCKSITLVYDDSNSMWEKNNWIYANYATQVLTGLLDNEDDLHCIRMSEPTTDHKLSLERNSRKASLKTIEMKWKPKGNTPYNAVQEATHVFKKGHATALKPLGEKQETDWLIVTTDGAFDTNGEKTPPDVLKKIREHARLFFNSTAGKKTRVVFLLIGNNADESAANIWKDQGPGQVETIKTNSSDINEKMAEIASVIAGRDKSISFQLQQDNAVHFHSKFPLKRITFFEQSENETLGTIQRIQLAGADQQFTKEELRIKPPNIKTTNGKITHLTHQGDLPAGKYTIHFNRPLNIKKFQIFIEPAVDFNIDVFHSNGKKVPPDTSSNYTVCAGDEYFFLVKFNSTKNGKITELPIDASIQKQLKVTGTIPSNLFSEKVSFTYDQKYNGYISSLLRVNKDTPLSLESQYPGYFHLKSNIITLRPQSCTKNSLITVDELTVPIKYTDSITYEKTGTFGIIRKGDNYQGNHRLSISGLPKGVHLEIAGKTITKNDIPIPVTLDFEKPLEVEVLTNNEFSPKKPVTFSAVITTDNQKVKKISPIEVILKMNPRVLAITPTSDKWQIPLDQLKTKGGPEFTLMAGGKQVTPDEIKQEKYTIRVETEKRIGLAVEPVYGSATFLIRVQPSLSLCLTDTGTIPVNIMANSSIPGETVNLQYTLIIEDIPWLDKCWRTILLLLCILLFFAYFIACCKKRRFARDSVIIYTRENPVLNVKSRPEQFHLAGWLADSGNRGWNFFSRWFIPFVPERRVVSGISFEAGDSDNTIILPPEQQRDNMKIDSIPIDEPGIHPHPLSLESTMEILSRNQTEQYTYHRA